MTWPNLAGEGKKKSERNGGTICNVRGQSAFRRGHPSVGVESLLMALVWIASYPKSGNTWLRFLLANYLAGPVRHSEQVEELIPNFTLDVDRTAFAAKPGLNLAKTHFPWSVLHPYAAATQAALVVIRNPKDVLLSGLDYQRLIGLQERDVSDLDYARAFIVHGGDMSWIARGYGTLEDNVHSWTSGLLKTGSAGAIGDLPPRLLVRYERLKVDAAGELGRILEFLGVRPDSQRMAQAVVASGFEQMRALEVKEKTAGEHGWVFAGSEGGRDRYFVSKGRTGSSLAHIHPELDQQFNERFHAVMLETGYAS